MPSSPFTTVISPMTGTMRPCPCMYVLATCTDSSSPEISSENCSCCWA